MILDGFGPDASVLLVAGALGGLVRGLVSLRAKSSSGPLTTSVIQAVAVDIVTSIVIGSMFSLFLSQYAMLVVGPVLENVNAGTVPKVATSGFVAGLIGIAIITYILDLADKRAKLKAAEASSPPATLPGGTTP